MTKDSAKEIALVISFCLFLIPFCSLPWLHYRLLSSIHSVILKWKNPSIFGRGDPVTKLKMKRLVFISGPVYGDITWSGTLADAVGLEPQRRLHQRHSATLATCVIGSFTGQREGKNLAATGFLVYWSFLSSDFVYSFIYSILHLFVWPYPIYSVVLFFLSPSFMSFLCFCFESSFIHILEEKSIVYIVNGYTRKLDDFSPYYFRVRMPLPMQQL